MNDQSIYLLLLNASAVVQAVILLLLVMSITVWAVAFAKGYQLKKARKASIRFEETFWKTQDLTQLYNQLAGNYDTNKGLSAIFESGFKEFVNLKKQGITNANDLVAGTQRAMKIAFSREIETLENHTPLLASVGSSAPYIGLFGTVWGVMHAFSGLGSLENATLAAVAPGISEALIATAIGLFAAIPAVIAYNRLTNKTERLINQYETFAEGFLTIVQRQANAKD